MPIDYFNQPVEHGLAPSGFSSGQFLRNLTPVRGVASGQSCLKHADGFGVT